METLNIWSTGISMELGGKVGGGSRVILTFFLLLRLNGTLPDLADFNGSDFFLLSHHRVESKAEVAAGE